jgi:Na+/proline symporter
LIAASAAGRSALITFAVYLAAVFVLAALANRIRSKHEFAGEYFLGSKGLGMWAFALTAAATSASGGSFMGFPALVYTHGWSVAWWISGYALVPLVTLGLFAKRINQVGRISGAITIPELLHARFASSLVGSVATLLIVFFLFFFLIAQFKAGAEIMATLLDGVTVYQRAAAALESATGDLPWLGRSGGDYLLCLVVFAATVIAYTTFGGFRAVVWTDVMQGIVMAMGVAILLVLTLVQVGGLANATRELTEMTPPEFGTARLQTSTASEADLRLSRGDWVMDQSGHILRLNENATIVAPERSTSGAVEVLRITTAADARRMINRVNSQVVAADVDTEAYAFGGGTRAVYVTAPGPSRTSPAGFMTVALAFSFFVFWNFASAGQPSQQVRQMAFDHTATLRRSIIVVTFFFGMIYFPLVIIFTSARILLPGMEIHADRVMPEMAAHVTSVAGVPWLAGLLVAAPFAAVMSSVDSFLLIVSSGVVRDTYQQYIRPDAPRRTIKRLSYTVTLIVGLLAVLAALNPPRFLQDLVVFASAGLAAAFLVPVVFALYWPRTTAAAVTAGMITGAGTILALYVIGYFVRGEFGEYHLLGMHPFVWSIVVTALVVVASSLLGREPDRELVETYFGTPSSDETSPDRLSDQA